MSQPTNSSSAPMSKPKAGEEVWVPGKYQGDTKNRSKKVEVNGCLHFFDDEDVRIFPASALAAPQSDKVRELIAKWRKAAEESRRIYAENQAKMLKNAKELPLLHTEAWDKHTKAVAAKARAETRWDEHRILCMGCGRCAQLEREAGAKESK